jgi:hypothetical protein
MCFKNEKKSGNQSKQVIYLWLLLVVNLKCFCVKTVFPVGVNKTLKRAAKVE